MKWLITGGCGFLGSNLAAKLFEDKNNQVYIIDNLYRSGSEQNLVWLKTRGQFQFFHCDIRSFDDVKRVFSLVKPDQVLHLAGQVAMTTSIERPYFDFEVNVKGSLHVLESVREFCPNSSVIYSSTNKVYGDLEWMKFDEEETRYSTPEHPFGVNEKTPLDFHSPYGTSKGSADQYMLDYHRIFGLKTVVFRHSSMFGGRQFSTFDQGWLGWFCEQAIKTKNKTLKSPFTISGNGKQVRDVLYIDDMIRLYFQTVKNIDRASGEAFNIGGGMTNSLSLLELFSFLEKEVGCKLDYQKLPTRVSDQKVFVADIRKAEKLLDWKPEVDQFTGLRKMINWVESL